MSFAMAPRMSARMSACSRKTRNIDAALDENIILVLEDKLAWSLDVGYWRHRSSNS